MERFLKLVNGQNALIIFTKRSILGVWQGYEYASVLHICSRAEYWKPINC